MYYYSRTFSTYPTDYSMKYLIFLVIATTALSQGDKTVSFTIPSAGIVSSGLPFGYFKIQENNTVTIPVTVVFTDLVASRNGTGSYRVRFDGVTWIPSSPFATTHSSDATTDANRLSQSVMLDSNHAFKPVNDGKLLYDITGSLPESHRTIIATNGSNQDELDKAYLLDIDFTSFDKATVIQDLAVRVSTAGGPAVVSTLYLYDGSLLLETTSVDRGFAHFSGANIALNEHSLKKLTVKGDIRNAGHQATSITAYLSSNDIKVSTAGARGTGIAQAGPVTVRNHGVIARVLSSSISQNTASFGDLSRKIITVTYNIQLTVLGQDVIFGPQNTYETFRFSILRNEIPVR